MKYITLLKSCQGLCAKNITHFCSSKTVRAVRAWPPALGTIPCQPPFCRGGLRGRSLVCGGSASRRPRPTGVTAQGRAATWGRPYGPHPPRFARHLPPEEGLRAGHGPAPTAESGPGALVRQSQARKWNRTGPNFPHIQGPVAWREFRTPLRFCAPEMLCPPQGVTPVMGSGERRL